MPLKSLYRDFGVRDAGFGVREGVPLMRHAFLMGILLRRGKDGLRIWDLGFWEGGGLMAAIFYRDFAQAGVKSPY